MTGQIDREIFMHRSAPASVTRRNARMERTASGWLKRNRRCPAAPPPARTSSAYVRFAVRHEHQDASEQGGLHNEQNEREDNVECEGRRRRSL